MAICIRSQAVEGMVFTPDADASAGAAMNML
jgi:hypothetical protein